MHALLKKQKILTVILTYNEEKHIGQVIEDLKREFNYGDILIIDGESHDKTAEISKKLGAWVIELSPSLGISGAMEMAFLFAKEMNYDYLIRIDGDGQHPPKDILKLMPPILENKSDMIIGSRFKKGWNEYESPFTRSFAIRFFSFIVSILARQPIYDTTSGMFVANKKVIRCLSNLKNFEYSEVVTFLILKKAGLHILEVPIKMRQRIGSQSSFNFIKSFYYVFLGVMSLFLIKITKFNDGGVKRIV